MKVSLKFVRGTLLISAALLVVAAIVIGAGVIPPVKADLYPQATPEEAAPALWIISGGSFFIAAIVAAIAVRITADRRSITVVLGVMAFLILLFAFALNDAAEAYGAHGPAMCTASILLFICAAADLLAAVLVIISMFLIPRRT
jgi:hypothetical protein